MSARGQNQSCPMRHLAFGIVIFVLALMPTRQAHAQWDVYDSFALALPGDQIGGIYQQLSGGCAFSTWPAALCLVPPSPGTFDYDMNFGFNSVVAAIRVLSGEASPRNAQAGADQQRIENIGGRDADLLGQASVAPNSITCQSVRAAQVAGAMESAIRGATINFVNAAMTEGRNPKAPPPNSLQWKTSKICNLYCEKLLNPAEYGSINFNTCNCP